MEEGISPGNTLGCYVPLRAMPYLSMLSVKSNVRLFDDNSGIHGQYFDGFEIPVESFEDLISRPVSHLIILSDAFGEVIKTRVEESLPSSKMKI